MSTNRLYQVALNLVPGVGDVLIKHLVSYCGSPEAVFKTTKSKGTGIGLYQTKQVIQAHQGDIEVESEEGRGCKITVILPFKVSRGFKWKNQEQNS